MEPHVLLMTALRAVAVYILMLVVIRLMGKRTVGNFSAFDLLVALMMGEVVDEIIYGDVTFLQGVIPIVVVALLHEANSWLTYWDHGFNRLLEGKPSVVVRDGRIQHRALRGERMSPRHLMSELREQGIADLREVKLATVEHDGNLSVLHQDWAEPAQKADLVAQFERARRQATDGRDDPPGARRTDTPDMLGEPG